MAACPSGAGARCVRPAHRRSANSVSRSLSMRRRKAARMLALVLSRTAMMKGKPCARHRRCSAAGTRPAPRRSAHRARRWPVRRSIPRSGGGPAASLPARSGWARSTPMRSSSEARAEGMRASALCSPAAVSCAGPSSSACARSAIQGECSKMPPKRATKVARSICDGRGWPAGGWVAAQCAAIWARVANQTPSCARAWSRNRLQGLPPGPGGPIRRQWRPTSSSSRPPPGPRRRGSRSCRADRRRSGRPC
jgi:hypothetical protein